MHIFALQPMLTLEADYQASKTVPIYPHFAGAGNKSQAHPLDQLEESRRHKIFAARPPADSPQKTIGGDQESKLLQTSDIPLLISDSEGEDSDADSDILSTTKSPATQFTEQTGSQVLAAEVVKRSIKDEQGKRQAPLTTLTPSNLKHKRGLSSVSQALIVDPLHTNYDSPSAEVSTEETFKSERGQVMKIIVKYIAMKITNSFPPPSSRTAEPEKIALDEYLMILSSRLQLTLPQFMKGIIYLFRYMDIIYLLRYFNQSNNFANYTDMGHGLKKLLIGCFRLVLAKERVSKDWSGITGLTNREINSIVKTLVGRLNGKLMIKNVELVNLRSEMFRFVKMVTKTV